MKIFYILFFQCICLTACKEKSVAVFTTPQPAQEKNFHKIPRKLYGRYLSLSDNSIVRINESTIERIYEGDDTLTAQDMKDVKILNDTLIDLQTGEKIGFRKSGELFIVHLILIDTIFHLSEDFLLRKYKATYFLNSKYDDAYWDVEKLQWSNQKLWLSSISSEEDFDKDISAEAEEEALPYKISMDRKEFKKFVKSGGFSSTEAFIRIK